MNRIMQKRNWTAAERRKKSGKYVFGAKKKIYFETVIISIQLTAYCVLVSVFRPESDLDWITEIFSKNAGGCITKDENI